MASSIHHIKMSFQTHPNVPFLQGWPGILAAEPHRKPPAVHGFMELRISGNTQVKAKYLTIEFVRLEHLPNTDPAKPIVTPIGTTITAWSAPHGAEWAYLEPADFKFYIPLPLNLPGSVELKPKGGGIRYELQARLCQVHKSGVLRRESDNIMVSGQPIYITKHELHAAWPIYNIPETKQMTLENMEMTVSRPFTAFGPTDRVEVTATLKSNRQKPLKLRAFEMQLIEVVTIRPPVPKGVKQASFPKSRVIHEVRVTVTEKIARTEAKSRVLALTVPAGPLALTVTGGQVINVKYELAVKAVMEGTVDLKIEHLEAIVGTYPRARSQEVVNQIGWVDALCPQMKTSPDPSTRSPGLGNHGSVNGGGQQYTPTFSPGGGNGSPWVDNSPSVAFNMYGEPSRPGSIDQRQRAQPFASRPLSTDASSMYSFNQSQSEVSSMRDSGRDDSGYGNRLTNTRPLSHIGSFAMPEPFVYNSSSPNAGGSPTMIDNKRVSMPAPRVLEYGSAHGHGQAGNARPMAPLRSGSAISTRNSIASEASGSRRSLDMREKSRLASLYNGSGELEGVPSRRSYIHQDAGPVSAPQLQAMGSPMAGGSSSRDLAGAAAPDERWSSAEAEKERLYAEARRRAARTQSAAGGQVVSMGLAEDDTDPPAESPPSYSPPERPSSAMQSALETKLRDKPLVDKEPSDASTRQRSGTIVGLGIEKTEHQSSLRASGLGREDRSVTPSAPSRYQGNGTGDQFATGASTVPAALSDKEQMKRFYDAQQAVQGNLGSASGSGSSSGRTPVASPQSSYPTRYPTADEEKDLMRKRYDQASRAVSQTYEGGSSSTHSNTDVGLVASHSGTEARGRASDKYPSAEEEKERMRARYEDAMRGVQGMQLGGSSGIGASTGPGPSRSASAFSDRRNLTVSMGKEDAPSGGVQPRASPELPPLPARPPAEYKTLLSPATEGLPTGAMPGMMPMGMGGYPGYFYSPMMQPMLSPMMYGQAYPSAPGLPGPSFQQG